MAIYWQIGRRILESEQGGEERAEYGEALIKTTCRGPNGPVWERVRGRQSESDEAVLFGVAAAISWPLRGRLPIPSTMVGLSPAACGKELGSHSPASSRMEDRVLMGTALSSRMNCLSGSIIGAKAPRFVFRGLLPRTASAQGQVRRLCRHR